MTATRGDKLRRRRCLGLQVAIVLGVLLAVVNRKETILLVVALALLGIVVVTFWRDCRRPRRDP